MCVQQLTPKGDRMGPCPRSLTFWSPTQGWVCSCHPPDKHLVLFSKNSYSGSNHWPGRGGGVGEGEGRAGSLLQRELLGPKILTLQV